MDETGIEQQFGGESGVEGGGGEGERGRKG